ALTTLNTARTEASAYATECQALLSAGILSLLVCNGLTLHYLSDCQSALAAIDGSAQYAADGTASAASNTHLLRRELNPQCSTYGYVPGHAGVLPNEVVDTLSKIGAAGKEVSCGLIASHNLTLRWFANGASLLPWVAVALRSLFGDVSLPSVGASDLGHNRCHGGLSELDLLAPFVPARAAKQTADSRTTVSVSADLHLRVATFNTLSLLGDPAEREPAGLTGGPARAAILAAALAENDIHIACLQETRSDRGQSRVGDYVRYAAGAVKGQWGTEVWIKQGLSLLRSSCRDDGAHFEVCQATVLTADPRRIFVRLHSKSLAILVVSLHGPHRAFESGTIRQWWEETSKLLKQYCRADYLVIGGDFNAAVGSEASEAIGSHAAELEDEAGSQVRLLTALFGLWAPATFDGHHHGPTHTYHQKKSGRLCRPDLILVPTAWAKGCVSSRTSPDIHAAHVCQDHVAAVVDLRLALTANSQVRRTRRIKARDVVDEANRGKEGLSQLTADQPRRPRHPYLTEGTWYCSDTFETLYMSNAWVWQMEIVSAIQVAQLRTLGLALRAGCKRDRDAYVEQLALQFSEGPSQQVYQNYHKLLVHKRRKPFQLEPLPMLNKADGTQCLSAAETNQRWREHFGSLEGGQDISYQALAAAANEAAVPLEEQRLRGWIPYRPNFAGTSPLIWCVTAVAMHKGATSFVLFADIASAFYCTVTQLVANKGGAIDEDLLQRITDQLHIAQEDVASLRQHLAQPSAMSAARAEPWLEAITDCLSTGNWFVLRGDSTPIATARGSRPGSSFADIVFALLLPKVLQARDALRATSQPAAVAPHMPWDGNRSLGPCAPEAPDITIDEIMWADDIAIPRWCMRNHATRTAIAVEAGALADACAEHGLRLSYGATKTAALASVCGQGSRAIRKALYGSAGFKGTLEVVREHAAPVTLPLVGHYKHLGAVQAPGGAIRSELRHRIASAKTAYHEARRKIFKNRGIKIHRKAMVLEATVLSRLTQGAGSWPSLCKADQAAFDATIWHFYRGILCIPRAGPQDIPALTCCALVRLPPPDVILRRARLQYLRQLVAAGPPQLWACVKDDRPYCDLLANDLRWVYGWTHLMPAVEDPDSSWESWRTLMSQRPGVYKNIVRTACKLEGARIAIVAALDGLHRGLHGLAPSPAHIPAPSQQGYTELCVP
ncbi:unnamed protein product, partial [Symbiodinium necroappetens]